MGFVNQLSVLPNILMNKFSSIFLAADAVSNSSFDLMTLFSNLIAQLVQLFYFSCKWALYLIDVMYFYILQLAGVTIDTSSLEAMTSTESDMIFNFLINNQDLILQIIRNFIGIAIILILVTAMIAIIKQQFASIHERDAKKSKTSNTSIFRSIAKSLLLIVLTPLMAIIGILASNILLKTLFNATNLSNTPSLSARVFNISASAANRYRIYAEDGVRIPIKFDFNGENRETAINYAVQVFGNKYFPNQTSFHNEYQYKFGIDNYLTYDIFEENDDDKQYLDLMNDRVLTQESFTVEDDDKFTYSEFMENYYTYFDHSDAYNEDNPFARFESYRDEYLVMADVIEYAMDTMEPIYFTTIEEVLESVKDNKFLFTEIIEKYNIKIIGSDADKAYLIGKGLDSDYFRSVTVADKTCYEIGNLDDIDYDFDMMREAINLGRYKYIRFQSKYDSGVYTYTHIKGATDELEGAKYVVSVGDSHISYVEDVNGQYVKNGSKFDYINKYYIQMGSEFKKADFYYERKFHLINGYEYKKVDKMETGKTYYYKVGNDYFKYEGGLSLYYKLGDDYVKINASTKFYEQVTKYTYSPLSVGYTINQATLESDYLELGNIIVAKGLFDESGYPTAIRKTSSGDTMFYRDELEYASTDTISDAASLDQAETDENGGGGGIFGAAVSFIASLFNPAKLMPNLDLDPSQIALEYTNKTVNVFTLKQGKLHISYFFSDAMTSKLSSSLYGVKLYNLFNPMSINYVILVVGTAIMLKICFQSVFALIARTLDLFMLILIYPLACATIPISDYESKGSPGNSGYAKWSLAYTRKLLSTYGLILALNLVFVLLPIIDQIEFISITELQDSLPATRIGTGLMTIGRVITFGKFELQYSHLAKFVNGLLAMICQLVAFSVIAPVGKKGNDETFYSAIQKIAGGEDLDNNAGTGIIKIVKDVAKTVNFIVSPPHKKVKMVMEKSKEVLKQTADFIPGSALAKKAIEKQKEMKKENEQREAKKDLLEALHAKAPAEEVQEKVDIFNKAFGTKVSLGNKAPDS